MLIGKNAAPAGVAPAIALIDPRFAYNVGMVVRLASCYGLQQVWYTGDRVRMEVERRGKLPREERMKGYKEVEIVQFDRPLEQFRDCTPVAVEVRPSSERLQDFEHPKNAVYVFGPEDGSIPQSVLRHCHRFVIIPTRNRYCLNLATATATILWDRALKLGEIPEEEPELPYVETDPKGMGLYDDCGWPGS
jgi:tRNA(Leu) C34 or U34 (ribose-2'-O)-methylase TrmL